ncbi:HTH-type transcriptional regulator VirS [Cupriavidus yeoncheonensis]|uniref:HTH-type transcriptional regulator VirS n=1 Tax=Cupriavidus yeoncheonensis TaxID=1462994 RepID=A0A916NG76_9BURK|nr:HTH-type transcriptional regulator VirS [Cupriavidus yeoncheonensis]
METLSLKPPARSVPIGTLARVIEALEALGTDPWPILARHGVSPAAMHEPMAPVALSVCAAILADAAEASACPHLGVLVGARANMENAGPLRLLVLSSGTVRDAVEGILRYGRIWYRGIDTALSIREGFASFSVEIDGSFTGREELASAYIAANVQLFRMLLGKAWSPTAVHLSRPSPVRAGPYTAHFGTHALFGQPRDEFLFPAETLEQRRGITDKGLESSVVRYLSELESHVMPDFLGQVRQAIRDLMLLGECTATRLASLFAVHRFTLHRHLQDYDTSFAQLLDEEREALAGRLLSGTDMPLGDIAGVLGFKTQAGFNKAFLRWRGVSPGTLRAGQRRRPRLTVRRG